MATIRFKAKIHTMYFAGEEAPAYNYVRIPTLTVNHCQPMHDFRVHPKYGCYANSDLFPQILKGIKESVFGTSNTLKMNNIPDGVTVDTSGFLAIVSFEV
jgi:hypothetical protein